jgi:hypothetical protein
MERFSFHDFIDDPSDNLEGNFNGIIHFSIRLLRPKGHLRKREFHPITNKRPDSPFQKRGGPRFPAHKIKYGIK